MSIALFCTILLSSPLGGVLWQIHDMHNGFIPNNDEIWRKINKGIAWGFMYSWLIVLLSIPLNLIGLVVGYASLNKLSKHTRNRN